MGRCSQDSLKKKGIEKILYKRQVAMKNRAAKAVFARISV
jgi:hypothetical protein